MIEKINLNYIPDEKIIYEKIDYEKIIYEKIMNHWNSILRS